MMSSGSTNFRKSSLLVLGGDLGAEAHGLGPDALLDDVLDAHEGAAADEQDVGGVHLDEFLVGVLAAALGRHVGHGAFDELEQGLLHALAARRRG